MVESEEGTVPSLADQLPTAAIDPEATIVRVIRRWTFALARSLCFDT